MYIYIYSYVHIILIWGIRNTPCFFQDIKSSNLPQSPTSHRCFTCPRLQLQKIGDLGVGDLWSPWNGWKQEMDPKLKGKIIWTKQIHPGRLTAGTYSHHPWKVQGKWSETQPYEDVFHANLPRVFQFFQAHPSCGHPPWLGLRRMTEFWPAGKWMWVPNWLASSDIRISAGRTCWMAKSCFTIMMSQVWEEQTCAVGSMVVVDVWVRKFHRLIGWLATHQLTWSSLLSKSGCACSPAIVSGNIHLSKRFVWTHPTAIFPSTCLCCCWFKKKIHVGFFRWLSLFQGHSQRHPLKGYFQ